MAMVPPKTWQKIETYVIVTIITVLVWLYAEAETVKSHKRQIEVSFVGSETQLIKPDTKGVDVTFRCTSAQLADIETLKTAGLKIDLTADPEGVRTIRLRDRLASNTAIVKLGIGVDSVIPRETSIKIERIVGLSMPIVFDAGSRELVDDPRVNPNKALVKMPSSLKDQLTDLKLTVRLDEESFVEVPEAVQHTIDDVSVIAPPQLNNEYVKGIPDTVSVTLTIKKQSASMKWSVPIHTMTPPDAMGRYMITLPDRLVEVELRGPPETIKRIKVRELKTLAVVEFNNLEELDEAVASSAQQKSPSKQATLYLPLNVLGYPATPLVQFTVQRVQTDESEE